ncbi:MAG: hypothetical protein ACT4TC_00245 [Myxococcaceae bacterium]
MSKTVVMSLSEVGWTVYRVRTASSEYHLGLFAGGMGRRQCAVLRGMSHGLGRSVDMQDSAPLVGGKSLFEVPPSEWIGKQLEIGTTTTSPVRSVDEERDRGIVTSITSAASLAVADSQQQPARTYVRPVQPAPPESEWAPYPEDYVERVEIAAKLLRSAYQKRNLVEDLKARSELLERFQLGLSECFLMLKAMGGKMTERA